MSALIDLLGRRVAYAAAELKILQGQSYSIGDGVHARTLTRADPAEVRAAIAELDVQIAASQSVTNQTRRILYLR